MHRVSRRLRLNTARVALALTSLSVVAVAHLAPAQSSYPTTAAPPAAWGGYSLPQQVPYQPTLGGVSPGGSRPPAVPPTVPTIAATPPALPIAVSDSSGPANSSAPIVIVPAESAATGAAVYPAYPCPDAGCCPPGQANWPAPYCETAPQAQAESLLPPGTRDGVFQKAKFTGAWLPRFEDDSLGMTDLQVDVVFGLPLVTRETPLVITPTYAVHYLDGPVTPDLPPRLHDAQVDFEHFRHIGKSWLVDLDVTIGEHADDYSFDAADAFRITGSGAVVYEWSPAWKWVLGLAYVDRANEDFLPIAGFIYVPNDDVEYKLVFPAPRVSWRLPSTAVPGRDERWLYVAGEFGGGVWAVQRASGASDKLDVTDWRVFLGVERKIVGGLSRRVEVGYVFGRTLQYASVGTDVSLDDTIMLRAGVTY